jgi:hypothetical protein
MQTGHFIAPGSFHAHFAEETVFHLALPAKEFGISRTAHSGVAVFTSLRNPGMFSPSAKQHPHA